MDDLGTLVYLNGEYVPHAAATVSYSDRGLVLGDGIYEAMRIYAGRPFAMRQHIERMKRSAAAIDLDVDPLIDALPRATLALAERNHHDDAVVYWQITRGPGPRDRRYPAEPHPTVLATTTAAPPVEARGPATVRVILHDDIRWPCRHIKALTLLPTVLARNRALAAGADDVLFHEHGIITEATAANALVVLDGTLWTHPTDGRILPGVTRGIVLELAREAGLNVREEPPPVDRLASADEVMLTGTTTRVTTVTHIDGRPVGTGETGPIARQLFAALQARVRHDCGL